MFGRLPVCDVPLEHPSISRYHAILQHRPQDEKRREGEGVEEGEWESERRVDVLACRPSEAGFYVYDLASTHGTYLNKKRIQPRSYYRVRVGQMIRFGGSSRLFVLEVHGEQGNTTNLDISFSMENEKRAAQVGFKPITYVCIYVHAVLGEWDGREGGEGGKEGGVYRGREGRRKGGR